MNEIFGNLDELIAFLKNEEKYKSVRINQHIVDMPGRIQNVQMPFYLYRGQQYAYSTEERSNNKLGITEVQLLDNPCLHLSATPRLLRIKEPHRNLITVLLSNIVENICNHRYIRIRLNSIGYPPFVAIPIAQHYGFPTYALDVTFDIEAAGIFSAKAGKDKDQLGVIYRIPTELVVHKTKLMMIPPILGLTRPNRQSAAWLDMGVFQNRNSKKFDYDLFHLRDIIESFYFRHTDKDAKFEDRIGELYRISDKEWRLVKDCLFNIPRKIDARSFIVDNIEQNCFRVFKQIPYVLMNELNLNSEECDILIQLSRVCLSFNGFSLKKRILNYKIKRFVNNWPEIKFEPIFAKYISLLSSKISRMILLNRFYMSEKVYSIFSEWLSKMRLENFSTFLMTLERQMRFWADTFNNNFSLVEVSKDTREVIRLSLCDSFKLVPGKKPDFCK